MVEGWKNDHFLSGGFQAAWRSQPESHVQNGRLAGVAAGVKRQLPAYEVKRDIHIDIGFGSGTETTVQETTQDHETARTLELFPEVQKLQR